MKIIQRLMMGVMLATTATACAPRSPQTPRADRQAIEAEVTTWLQAFWETWAEGGSGFDRGIAMFDDHPDFTFAADGVLFRSVAAVDEAFRPFFRTVDHQTFEVAQTAITALGPDLAYASQEGTYRQWLVDGTDSGPFRFAATFLLTRTDGGWRVRAYHQSQPDQPTTDAG